MNKREQRAFKAKHDAIMKGITNVLKRNGLSNINLRALEFEKTKVRANVTNTLTCPEGQERVIVIDPETGRQTEVCRPVRGPRRKRPRQGGSE